MCFYLDTQTEARSSSRDSRLLQTKSEKVGPPGLDGKPKSTVPWNHFVAAVQCQLVTVEVVGKLDQRLDQPVAQLLASVVGVDDHVFEATSLRAKTDR